MGWKNDSENQNFGFIIIGISGFAIFCIFLMIAGAFIGGIEFILSLIADHIIIGIIIMAILDALFYLALISDRNDNRWVSILGFLITMIIGFIASGISLVSCCGVLKWYLNESFQHDIISSFIMLIVGPLIVFILGLVPIGCKYFSWTIVILAEDDGRLRSFWGEIIIYILLSLLGIILCTTLTYFLGNGSPELIRNVHSDFFKNIYNFFVEINPLNRIINMI